MKKEVVKRQRSLQENSKYFVLRLCLQARTCGLRRRTASGEHDVTGVRKRVTLQHRKLTAPGSRVAGWPRGRVARWPAAEVAHADGVDVMGWE